jgi:hypothetical protein
VHVSVSTDNVIYLISDQTKCLSVNRRRFDVESHVSHVADDWQCWQVIKVSTDNNTDVLWTVVESAEDWRLRVYTVDKRRAIGDNVTWRDVTLVLVVFTGLVT